MVTDSQKIIAVIIDWETTPDNIQMLTENILKLNPKNMVKGHGLQDPRYQEKFTPLPINVGFVCKY